MAAGHLGGNHEVCLELCVSGVGLLSEAGKRPQLASVRLRKELKVLRVITEGLGRCSHNEQGTTWGRHRTMWGQHDLDPRPIEFPGSCLHDLQ